MNYDEEKLAHNPFNIVVNDINWSSGEKFK